MKINNIWKKIERNEGIYLPTLKKIPIISKNNRVYTFNVGSSCSCINLNQNLKNAMILNKRRRKNHF